MPSLKKLQFKYKNTSLVSSVQIEKTVLQLLPYTEFLRSVIKNKGYENPESALFLPFDKAMQKKIKAVVKLKKTAGLKYLIIIGIGGSNLATQALWEALRGQQKQNMPQIVFADTLSPELVQYLQNLIKTEIHTPSELLVNVVSKSGTTLETLVHFELILHLLSQKFSQFSQRIIVTTDGDSALWKTAQKYDFSTLEIPKLVGGRYSAFSAVSMLPLALLDFNTDEFFKGGRLFTNDCLSKNVQSNPALVSAGIRYLLYQKGVHIHNHFFFAPQLESLGKWHRQLLAESLGKRTSSEKTPTSIGITPLISIGSTDLHSLFQLYLSRPSDFFTVFISSNTKQNGIALPEQTTLPLLKSLKGRDIDSIFHSFLPATTIVYRKRRMPFMEIQLPSISLSSMGQYMQWALMEIMYLGRLFKINAFDQPEVEQYKQETRKILHLS